ncbi:outer membrane protein assembly factor BamE [Pelagibacteraceae bacterium]|nr:outer membrane protein assembly factor BamE [Pelagibacteraceae bacterium]
MFFKFKYHYKKILFFLFFILIGCQLQDPNKNHGIIFLENRAAKLVVLQTNKNDVLKIIGNPHTKSIENDDIWIYIERTLTKGKYHKLGKHVLKTNNALVLEFDKYGILENKKFYNKDDIKKVSFSKDTTENEMTKKSFVESFLNSVKEKMYGGK